jgi:hypothetical protein
VVKVAVSRIEIAVGVFVLLGAASLVVLFLASGGSEGLWTKRFELRATFERAPGVRPGTVVQMSGVDVGVVRTAELTATGRVAVVLSIDDSVRNLVRQSAASRTLAESQAKVDPTPQEMAYLEQTYAEVVKTGVSVLRIGRKGLLGGDPVLHINPARPPHAAVEQGAALLAMPPPTQMEDTLEQAQAVVRRMLTSVGQRGGLLSALLDDEGKLYDALVGLVEHYDALVSGEGNRVDPFLRGIERKLDATVSRLDETLAGALRHLETTTTSAKALFESIQTKGLLAAVDGPEGALTQRLHGVLDRLDRIAMDLELTTQELPALAGRTDALLRSGTDAVDDLEQVLGAAKRHWLLQHLVEPTPAVWLRGYDLAEGR